MKTLNLLLASVFIVFCASCSHNKTASQSSDSNSPLTEEISLYEKSNEDMINYFANNHIDDKVRSELKINDINYIRQEIGDSGTEDENEYSHNFLKEAENSYIVKGNVFRENDKGRMQRVYMYRTFSDDNIAFYEFLISYDKNGNYIDSKLITCTNISEIRNKIDGDVINVSIDAGGEGWNESYTIQPDLSIKKTHNFGEAL